MANIIEPPSESQLLGSNATDGINVFDGLLFIDRQVHADDPGPTFLHGKAVGLVRAIEIDRVAIAVVLHLLVTNIEIVFDDPSGRVIGSQREKATGAPVQLRFRKNVSLTRCITLSCNG